MHLEKTQKQNPTFKFHSSRIDLLSFLERGALKNGLQDSSANYKDTQPFGISNFSFSQKKTFKNNLSCIDLL
jgi:hypothetical protein